MCGRLIGAGAPVADPAGTDKYTTTRADLRSVLQLYSQNVIVSRGAAR